MDRRGDNQNFEVLWLTTREDENDPVWQGLRRKAHEASVQIRRVVTTADHITQLVAGYWAESIDGLLLFHELGSPHMLVLSFPVPPDSFEIGRFRGNESRYYEFQAEEVLLRGHRLYGQILYDEEFGTLGFGPSVVPTLVQHIQANPDYIRSAIDATGRKMEQPRLGAHARIIKAIGDSNDRLDEARRTKISHAMAAPRASEREQILQELDEAIFSEAQGLARLIDAELGDAVGTYPVIDDFLAKHGDILDEESREFLQSSSVLLWAANHLGLSDLDYGLPASGIWKAVERETNSTIVGVLRVQNEIAAFPDVWKPISQIGAKAKSYKAGDNSAKIGQIKDGEFRGIELGKMAYMLKSASDPNRGIGKDINEFLKGEEWPQGFYDFLFKVPLEDTQDDQQLLIWFLDKVAFTRNKHAHVAPMSKTVADELETLVLAEEDYPQSLSSLGKVLAVKKFLHSKAN